MSLIGNILWLILGGLLVSAFYIVVGLLCCITIIGIPFGYQLIKMGLYALMPFGREMRVENGEPGCLSIVFNLIWIMCGYWEIAIIHLVCGLLFYITIIGIPFGNKHFELMKAGLFPFGISNKSK